MRVNMRVLTVIVSIMLPFHALAAPKASSDACAEQLVAADASTVLSRLIAKAHEVGVLSFEEVREWMAQATPQVLRYKSAPTAADGALRRAIEKQVSRESKESWNQTQAALTKWLGTHSQNQARKEEVRVDTAKTFAPRKIKLPEEIQTIDPYSLNLKPNLTLKENAPLLIFKKHEQKGDRIAETIFVQQLHLSTKIWNKIFEQNVPFGTMWNMFDELKMLQATHNRVGFLGNKLYSKENTEEVVWWSDKFVVLWERMKPSTFRLLNLETGEGQLLNNGFVKHGITTKKHQSFVSVQFENANIPPFIYDVQKKNKVIDLPPGHFFVNFVEDLNGDAIAVYQSHFKKSGGIDVVVHNLPLGTSTTVEILKGRKAPIFGPEHAPMLMTHQPVEPNILFKKTGGFYLAVKEPAQHSPDVNVVVYDESGQELWRSILIGPGQLKWIETPHGSPMLLTSHSSMSEIPQIHFFDILGSERPIHSMPVSNLQHVDLVKANGQTYMFVNAWDKLHFFELFREIE